MIKNPQGQPDAIGGEKDPSDVPLVAQTIIFRGCPVPGSVGTRLRKKKLRERKRKKLNFENFDILEF